MSSTRRELLAAVSLLGIASLLPACAASGTGDVAARWRPGTGGRALYRGEADFESWRRAMPWQPWVADRSPECIVRPADRQQLAAALRAARASGYRIAVRSGGHNVAESFLREGGMLVDLDAFRAVSVDAATATARVEPALWGRDLLLALGRSGLAFPVSHCATVPMGGYLLGGGVGINTDEWGIACHGVVGAEVMLADGRLVEAGSAGHEELLWALRGAGTGFFGIVTRYELRCPALPRDVRENVFVFPGSRTAEVVDWLSGASARGMPRTEFMILLAQAAGKPGQTLCIARAVQFCDSEAESRALITPLAESAFASEALFRESLKPTTLDQLMIGSVDASRGLGFGRSHVHTVWTKDAPTAAAAAERLLARAPSPKSHMVISLRRDTTGRAGSSFSSVDRGFVGCYGIWDDATDDEANIAWLDTARESLQPFASGNYINELDAFRRPDLLERCFSADALARLHRLRQRYDPDGLFHDFPGLS